jgi:hypothetical protein
MGICVGEVKRETYIITQSLHWDDVGGGIGFVHVAGESLVGGILVSPWRSIGRLNQHLDETLGAVIGPANSAPSTTFKTPWSSPMSSRAPKNKVCGTFPAIALYSFIIV